MAQSDSGEQRGLLSILITPVLVIDLVAVFLFCLGWTYIYFLYYHFGINVHALDIPVYYFFIYAYPVVAGNVACFAAAALLPAASPLIVRWAAPRLGARCGWFPADGRRVVRALLAAYLAALFPLSFYLAQRSAEESAVDMRSGNAKTIRFVFKESAARALAGELVESNAAGRLKLLTQTSNRFIV
ncbi:MAG TPA: hypothetical protein VF586_13850, partial [Pyrinomonadaceae bacterium]